jgi:hypothetical protein
VTAPELHRVITEALFAHDWPDEDLAAECGAYSDDYRDAARAVLAALTEAGTVEWGVQGKTFIDGDWDRVWTKNVNNGPFTEEQAKNHLWLKSPVPYRVVSRLTLPWGRAE